MMTAAEVSAGVRRRARQFAYAAQARRIVRTAARDAPPIEVFGAVTDPWWGWANLAGRQRPELVAHLPSLPDDALQRRTTGVAGDATLQEAFRFYRLVKSVADTHHVGGFATCRDVLDFGCGWGRITRFFLKDRASEHLIGMDCVDSVIDAAKATDPWATFVLTDAMPPSPFADTSFDLVYCYSVFSHLSEDAHLRWVAEFARVLRPGGLLVATTRPREFFYTYGRLRAMTGLDKHDQVVRAAFPGDPQEWLARYDRGEFCYSAVGIGKKLPGEFYGEAFIPLSYAKQAWAPYLNVVDQIVDRGRCQQDVLVARKD